MKNAILILIVLGLGLRTSAQVSQKQDSTKVYPKLQFAFGGYLGTNYYISNPTNSSYYSYQNIAGSDQGVFGKLNLNLTSHIGISVDIRYLWRSGAINYEKSVAPHIFLIKSRGIQLPLLFTYTIRRKTSREVLSLTTGVAYNRFQYHTIYDEPTDPRVSSTSPIIRKDIKTMIKTISGIFGLSKTFSLNRRNALCLFSEAELQFSNTSIQSIAPDYNSTNEIKYFKPLCTRLGCYFIF